MFIYMSFIAKPLNVNRRILFLYTGCPLIIATILKLLKKNLNRHFCGILHVCRKFKDKLTLTISNNKSEIFYYHAL